MSNAGEPGVAQIIEPEPPPPPPEPPEAPRQVESAPTTPSESLVDVIAPKGELLGVAENLGNPRATEASDHPASEVQKIHRPRNRWPNICSTEKSIRRTWRTRY